jgi:hypothetical protein
MSIRNAFRAHGATCKAMAAAALLVVPASGLAVVKVGDRLPAETHYAFWVNDLSDAREATEKNPFVQAMIGKEGAMGKGVEGLPRMIEALPISAVDPLGSIWSEVFPSLASSLQGGMDSATSVFAFEPKEFTDTFTDSVAIYSTLYDHFIENNVPIVEWDVILAAEFAEEQRPQVEKFLEKALARVPKDARKKKVSYSGFDVYHLEYFLDEQTTLPGDGPIGLDDELVKEIPVIVEYAFVNDTFLLAEGRGEPLARAVRALTREDSQFRLTSKPGFRKAREVVGTDGQFHLYMDLPHHVKEWRDWPSGSQQARLMDVLGLAQSGPVLVNGTVNSDKFELDATVVDTEDPQGLFPFLQNSPESDATGLSLIPGDAKTFGALSIDMKAAYDLLQKVMSVDQSRATPLLTMAINNIQSLTGVNIEQDLLPNSTGQMISYLRPGDTGSESTRDSIAAAFVLPLNGAKETIDAFNRLITKISSEETMLLDVKSTNLDGVTLWETPEAEGATRQQGGFYFAATSKGLVFSTSGAELRNVVRRITSDPEQSIRNDGKAGRFAAELPKDGLRGFAFMPSETLIQDLERRGRIHGNMTNQKSAMLEEELRRSVGDIYWFLRSGNGSIRLTYRIEAPEKGI